jgi:hypothetical protein
MSTERAGIHLVLVPVGDLEKLWRESRSGDVM